MAHTYTWDKLAKNAVRLNPKTRGPKYPSAGKFELLGIIPFAGTRSCLVRLQVFGITQNALHQVTLLFTDCEILKGEQKVSLWDYFKIEYKKEVYYVKKFNALRNPLTSRCSCADYFYTFAWYNYFNAHCLYGPAPRPYRRKTTWAKPRNPHHIPGICKHIFYAWQYLGQRGLTIN